MSEPQATFIIDQEFPNEELDDRYEILLKMYTNLRDHLGQTKSQKQLQAELIQLSSISKNENATQKEECSSENLDQNLEKLRAQKQQIINKFLHENKQLEDKVSTKRNEFIKIKENKTLQEEKLLSLKQKIRKNVDQIETTQNNLNKIRSDRQSINNITKILQAKLDQNHQSNLSSIKKDIQLNEKQLNDLNCSLQKLKDEIEALKIPKNQNKTQQNSEEIEKQIKKVEQQLTKQKNTYQKLSKQIQTQSQKLKNAQNLTKQSAQKQNNLKKELQKNKQSQQKLRKLIEQHVNQEKKQQQQKQNKKSKQNQEANQLAKLENQNAFYERSIVWESNKIEELKKKRQTYVDRKKMEGIFEQKKELQKFNKNAQTQNSKFLNVNKKLTELKDQVQKLQKQEIKKLNDKQNHVKQLKQRNNDLKKNIDQVQKRLSQNKVKLEEYQKQYPDHEAQKARAAAEQKRLKEEQNKRHQQQMNALKKQQSKIKPQKIKNTDDDVVKAEVQKFLSSSTPSTKTPISSILENPTYRNIGIGAAILILLVVYYAL